MTTRDPHPEPRWTVDVPAAGASTSAQLQRSAAGDGATLFVMAHGAGSDMEHATMAALAGAALDAGVDVLRFNFLYREQRRGAPDRMPALQSCFAAVVDAARQRLAPARLLIGGQSMGGRCASMLAAASLDDEGLDGHGLAADGVVLLAYPLHAPGRTDRLRAEHLGRIRAPVLCCNGTRDRLCQRDLMETVVAGLPPSFTMHWLEGADHGYQVLKRSGRTREEVFAEVGQALGRWLARALPTGTSS